MSALSDSPSLSGPLGQPDIGYTPNHDKYLDRARRRQETERLIKTVPTGFPPNVASNLVWDGNGLAETYDWNYYLTVEDLEEIESALRYFQGMLSFFLHGEETW